MGQASTSINLNASADVVWQLIGGFNSLPDWMPFIATTEEAEGGRVRHLKTPKGETIIERLEKFDQAARTYSYSFVHGLYPVEHFLATISVLPGDGGNTSRVDWTGTYLSREADEAKAQRHFQGIFESGLEALGKRFGVVNK